MKVTLAIIFSVLAGISAFKLYAHSSLATARKLYQSSDLRSNPSAIYSKDLAEALKKAESATFATNESNKLEASYLIDLARESQTTDEKLRIYCRALSTLKNAIKREPYDSKAMINWLDVQDLVKGEECAENISEEKRKEVIDTAVRNDPTNTEVLFAAGLLNHWSGNTDQAIPYFHSVLKLSTKVSTGREETMLETIKTTEGIRKLVPARFPQIVSWTELIRTKRPELYKRSVDEIEKMQAESVKQSLFELHEKLISDRIHLNNLESLLKVSAGEKVRKLLYEEIANTLGSESELGKYLKEKSALSEIPIVRASKAYDTLPHRGPLSGWNGTELVIFDTHETSLGFYKKESDKVKLVELTSSRRAQDIVSGELKFYLSDDNQNWREIFPAFRGITNPNIDRNYLIIELKNSNFKYFKVNFHSPVKRGSFLGRENEIINAFG